MSSQAHRPSARRLWARHPWARTCGPAFAKATARSRRSVRGRGQVGHIRKGTALLPHAAELGVAQIETLRDRAGRDLRQRRRKRLIDQRRRRFVVVVGAAGGSGMIASTRPSATMSGAVIFSAVAASTFLAGSRHRIAAQPSGGMTL